MAIETNTVDRMLAELLSAHLSSVGKTNPTASGEGAGGTDFAAVLKTAIDQVSAAQQSAQQMSEGFAAGDSNVNLQDVMVNLQKASLSFQQMVQVRNKLVTAYHDIMNMQV